MFNKIKEIRNKYINKKGASMMEFFVITIVVLLIGAAVFTVGKSMKDGVGSMDGKTKGINTTLNTQTSGFNSFD